MITTDRAVSRKQLKSNTMKTNFTFAEAAKIFAQVDKVIAAVKEQEAIYAEYSEIEAAFDDEFEKYNYSFFGAPQELHEMFNKKMAMYDKKRAAERKAYRAIKDFAALVNIDENIFDFYEEDIARYLKHKYYWQATDIVKKVKSIALSVSRKISFNAQ